MDYLNFIVILFIKFREAAVANYLNRSLHPNDVVPAV